MNDWYEDFREAARYYCERAVACRDSVAYSVLFLWMALSTFTDKPLDRTTGVVLAAAGLWEWGRAYSWFGKAHPRAREAVSASIVMANTFVAGTGLVSLPRAIQSGNGKEMIGDGLTFLITTTAGGAMKYRSGLTWKRIYELYRDVLFDHDDKENPPPRPRRGMTPQMG